MLSRRQILLLAALAGTNQAARAFPVSRLLGVATPEYLRELWRRLLKFHTEHFNWKLDKISKEQQKLILDLGAQLISWGENVSPTHLYSSFGFEHHFQNGQYSRQSLLLPFIATHAPLRTWFEKNKFTGQPSVAPFACRWFLDGQTFELVYPKVGLDSMKSEVEFQLQAPSKWLNSGLETFEFKQNKLSSHTYGLALEKPDFRAHHLDQVFDVVSAVKISDLKTSAWHLRLRSLYFPSLLGPAQKIAKAMSDEFNLSPHSIIYTDKNNFILQYP